MDGTVRVKLTLAYQGFAQYADYDIQVNSVSKSSGTGGPCSGGVNWTTTYDITVAEGDTIDVIWVIASSIGAYSELMVNESLGNIATDLLSLI